MASPPSGRGASLDGISAEFVGGHLVDAGLVVAVSRQPQLGRLAAFGEVQQFDAVSHGLQDADLADEIRRLMFVFDDLLKLDDKAIQSVLKEVDNNQWAVALKGASDEIRQKIFGNLSQRAAEMLKEEMEYLGPVRVSDVEAMQQQIVDTVRRLEDAGTITLSAGAGAADQFVS